MSHEFRWITGKITDKTQAIDSRGNPLYWKDSSKSQLTNEVTPYVAYSYTTEEMEKLNISLQGYGDESMPVSLWGTGDGVIKNTEFEFGDSARGYIYKTDEAFHFRYNASNTGFKRELQLNDDGILIESNGQPINLIGKGFKVESSDGMIQMLHSSGASFGISEDGNTITLKLDNGSVIELNNEGLYADINGDIDLNATGDIKLTGTKIDLN
ncbi:hypothetical protein [Paenibacillus sp. 2TAB19]|uniref:hypothetical protein n=1 Tax=Paenibacillus sp. 2TAB19 TaxID=3233003 RepID=UPI003F98973C